MMPLTTNSSMMDQHPTRGAGGAEGAPDADGPNEPTGLDGEPADSSAADAPRSAPPRVLLVEDESMLAGLQQRLLERVGAQVVGPVPTLAAARDLAAREQLDGAVIDLGLPDGSGADLLAELAPKGVVCAVLSGRARFEVDEAIDEHAATVLSKPVRAADLEQFLQQVRDAKAG